MPCRCCWLRQKTTYFSVIPVEQRVALVVDKDAIRTLEQNDLPKDSDTFTYAFGAAAPTRSLQERINPIDFHQYFLLHDWRGHITDKWINDTTKAILQHQSSLAVLWSWAGEAALDYFDATKAAQEKIGRYEQLFYTVD